MRCPFCNQDNSKVVDSRPVEDTNSIRRRRMCESCGKRFTTYEKVETIPLSVIKKDQTREQYDRAKIQDGILRACYKRPIPVEKIEAMMDSIEGQIFDSLGINDLLERIALEAEVMELKANPISGFDWNFSPIHTSSPPFSTDVGSVLHCLLRQLQPGHG